MEVRDDRKQGVLDRIKSNSFVQKVRGIKNIQLIAAVFIIAVALLIYSTVATGNALKGRSDSAVTANDSAMNDEEKKLSEILAGIEGAGEVRTMITRNEEGQIAGILVTAQGADDISVMLKLIAATTTAMGVDKKIVDVYTMK